jgi:cytochrome b subunit of formate dehydrogenase
MYAVLDHNNSSRPTKSPLEPLFAFGKDYESMCSLQAAAVTDARVWSAAIQKRTPLRWQKSETRYFQRTHTHSKTKGYDVIMLTCFVSAQICTVVAL